MTDGSTKRRLLALADKLAEARAAKNIPIGGLWRGITTAQYVAAREAFRAALDDLPHGDARAHVICTCPDCVKPRPTLQLLGYVTRYGRRSDGQPWVGIHCPQNGDVDPPDGAAVYTEVLG